MSIHYPPMCFDVSSMNKTGSRRKMSIIGLCSNDELAAAQHLLKPPLWCSIPLSLLVLNTLDVKLR
jgi:hypothetical protein